MAKIFIGSRCRKNGYCVILSSLSEPDGASPSACARPTVSWRQNWIRWHKRVSMTAGLTPSCRRRVAAVRRRSWRCQPDVPLASLILACVRSQLHRVPPPEDGKIRSSGRPSAKLGRDSGSLTADAQIGSSRLQPRPQLKWRCGRKPKSQKPSACLAHPASLSRAMIA